MYRFCQRVCKFILGCPITLIEENRDRMGHGTTGLISWQGAVALALWATESELFNQKVTFSKIEL